MKLFKILASGLICMALASASGALAGGSGHSHGHTHNHEHGHAHGHGHSHGKIEPAAGVPLPSVELVAHVDGKSGYNLQLKTLNFTFSPERTDQDTGPSVVEGHVHLYINGGKIGRVYSHWYHIPEDMLNAGENTIRVTLNDNTHRDWIVDGAPVAAEVTVMGKGKNADHAQHGHGTTHAQK